MVESLREVLPSAVGEVVLARRDFGGEVFGLAIEPRSVRQEILLIEGVGLMIGKLVISHNKKLASIISNMI